MIGTSDTFPDLPRRLAAILPLVANGRTNQEIAQQHHVAKHTAEKYVSELLTRTGCRNRAELIAVYWRTNLEREPAILGSALPYD